MGRADTYSQPDAPDPVLPDDLVLGLARAHSAKVQHAVGGGGLGGQRCERLQQWAQVLDRVWNARGSRLPACRPTGKTRS